MRPVFLLISLLLTGRSTFASQSCELSSLALETVVTLRADIHHIQGIDVEGNTLWVSSVDAKSKKGYLSKFRLPDGTLGAQVQVQEGERIHPGGLALDGDSLWIPVAEYDRNGPTTIQRRNKRTLALEQRFEVHDHIGCLAASPVLLVGGNWASRMLYFWTRDGRLISKQPNPSSIHYQDLKFDGESLVGSGDDGRLQGAVEWMNLKDFSIVKRLRAGATDRGIPYTHEGMTIRGGRLYLLPEDAPSRLFVFQLP
ncbi:MAG: DUF6454 family protein [Bryobacteraceae bacterium]|nr:DUF6454 family protein [Bryobacteraceae bacterium]MDW8377114.1 DUF6454 family protein [Bryobacterales bacterium]